MPRRPRELGSPKDWIFRAKSNLCIAEVALSPEVFVEDLCFNLQQAVEKALKAVLVHYGVPFPYTHDIGKLIQTVETAGIDLPRADKNALEKLTDYAIEGRYPGDYELASRMDYKAAKILANTVVAWAEAIISTTPRKPKTKT
jgi:HEPN domain-containing protein